MDIAIPLPAAGIVTLLGFFAPYAIAALNGLLPFVVKTWQKKLVSVLAAIALAVVVMVFYGNLTGEPIGDPWTFALLAIVVVQASYALITRDAGAKQIEDATTTPATVDDARNG